MTPQSQDRSPSPPTAVRREQWFRACPAAPPGPTPGSLPLALGRAPPSALREGPQGRGAGPLRPRFPAAAQQERAGGGGGAPRGRGLGTRGPDQA